MFEKVLIANRGEIALRIQRACRILGIRTVCIYSESDKDAKHVKLADEAVCIGPADPVQSYLNSAAIISAAEITDSEAIHPGYGFLSENADFAEQVEKSGFVFIGPSPAIIRTMGDKLQAKVTLTKAGIKMVPSVSIKDIVDLNNVVKEVEQIGFPLILKASAGGGGRGMKVINTEAALRHSLAVLSQEANRAFGDGTIYAEKNLGNARHIEIQVLADTFGNVVHLGSRDCSVQRRHQKILEEAPAPNISPKKLQKIGQASVEACEKIGYCGVGTMEFLFDNNQFYFIEMNTRVQVEHPVTECITGIDIIEWQIRVASGEKLTFKQRDINFNGHAIECRINAEDPVNHSPSPGIITVYHPAGGPGVRVDAHVYAGYEVTHHYDSLIGKLIVYGVDRNQAIAKMRTALSEFVIGGIKSNLTLHQRIMANYEFANGRVGIDFLDIFE